MQKKPKKKKNFTYLIAKTSASQKGSSTLEPVGT